MTRVLIDDFGQIAALGIRELLEEEGVDVVYDEPADQGLIERVVASLPDVVVLDLDNSQCPRLVQEITSEFPTVKVIAFSALIPRMRVFPPFHHGESYDSELIPSQFVAAVRSKA